MKCTLVTAYYSIKSKFNHERYLNWGKQLLSLSSPIILFTEESLVDTIMAMRGDKPIHIITIPFSELDTWKLYSNYWLHNHKLDPENSYHTPELYAIWAQKAFFVEEAINFNSFNTDHFFWCDFGAFRDEKISSSVMNSFPSAKYFKDDKIILQAIEPLVNSDIIFDENGIIGKQLQSHEIRLVGGLWGGSAKACLTWKKEYQAMLERYFRANRFAGKDQMVMLSTYLENPELATVVKCTKGGIDEWFFLEHLLSDEDVPFEIDSTYNIIKPTVSVNIMGGLGNQLFQVCAAFAYAKKYSGKLQILHKTNNGNRPLYFDSVLKNFQQNIVYSLPHTMHVWSEQYATKYSDIGPLTSHGKYLRGYLQSSKYFYNDDIKQQIKNLLKPDTQLLDDIKNKYNTLLENKDRVIVVHCRRTDYIPAAHVHGPLTGEYYKKAITNILEKVNNPIFLLCGDDMNYWNEIKNDTIDMYKHTVIALPPENDIMTFYLLQQFNNFIMSNSSFIWWCVWLSAAQNVFVPSKWFGPAGPAEYEDIYESSWIRI